MVYDRIITAMREYTAPTVHMYTTRMGHYRNMCATLTAELQALVQEKVLCMYVRKFALRIYVWFVYRATLSSG